MGVIAVAVKVLEVSEGCATPEIRPLLNGSAIDGGSQHALVDLAMVFGNVLRKQNEWTHKWTNIRFEDIAIARVLVEVAAPEQDLEVLASCEKLQCKDLGGPHFRQLFGWETPGMAAPLSTSGCNE